MHARLLSKSRNLRIPYTGYANLSSAFASYIGDLTMTDVQPAPGELELVREFVNTNDFETASSCFASPAQLGSGSPTRPRGGKTLKRRDLERAIELREALRALLLANAGEPLDPRAVERLNDPAARVRLLVRFERGRRLGARFRRGGADPWSDGRSARSLRSSIARWPRALGPAQGLPRRDLSVGLLRQVEEPLRPLVLDGGLRQPRQSTQLPPAPQHRAPSPPKRAPPR